VVSGWKFDACHTGTEVQQAILKTDIARSRQRILFVHVIEVLTGHQSGRDIAYRQPQSLEL
jgi:hypothetical protein